MTKLTREAERLRFLEFIKGYGIYLREVKPMVFIGDILCRNGGMATICCTFSKDKDLISIYDTRTRQLIHQVSTLSTTGRTKTMLDKLVRGRV